MSSKLNLLIGLNGYEDVNPTNNPSMNSFKWERFVQGLDIREPSSRKVVLAAEQELSLFSGTVSTDADGTTTWDLALKAGTTNTYRLSHNAGQAPNFRTARNTGADATTEVTVTKNGKVLTFTSTGGTLFTLIANGVVVGDEVRIGAGFNASNQGKYKLLSLTATSFSVENEIGVAEGPVTLGASFAEQIRIYSAAGVQIGDKLEVLAGFSPVSQNTYEITDVADDYVEFFSLDSLPEESNIANSPTAITIYREAKSLLYVESDAKLQITIDGSATPQVIEPMFAGKDKQQAFFLYTGTMRSVSIKNLAKTASNVFYVTAE